MKVVYFVVIDEIEMALATFVGDISQTPNPHQSLFQYNFSPINIRVGSVFLSPFVALVCKHDVLRNPSCIRILNRITVKYHMNRTPDQKHCLLETIFFGVNLIQ